MMCLIKWLIFTAILCIPFGLVAQSFVINPYLQDVTPSSTLIMWEVDDSGAGEIAYGTSPFDLNQNQVSGSILGSGSSQIHTAQLTGLNAKTKYYYRVNMEDGEESILYHFVTLANQGANSSTQLMAISDMQRDGSQPDKFREIIEDGIIPSITDEIGPAINDLEAVLIPGDLVVTGSNYSQWQTHFFNPSDSLFGYVPFYPVLGNHDSPGNGLSNFKKYMALPDNGAAGLEEECWYKDISNIRIIGLNSTSGAADKTIQLDWLGTILQSTSVDDGIDFVFAELHHPYKSELWTPGESDFTGMVIDSLQNFTTTSGKPSIHFFGHTHGYSRGQSRDHKHLWVNVATAGGAIDNWGEFPNADYKEFVKSQDEYGFVMLDIDAGIEPKFTLKRFSRGDQDVTLDNVLRDELTIYKNEYPPHAPHNIYPQNGDTVSANCLTLKGSQFSGVLDTLQASHWQIAKSGDFVDSLVSTGWHQNENWYSEVNLQADDDLTDAKFNALGVDETYYWRVRYRDQSLEWSEWSSSTSFYYETVSDTLSGNLVLNLGAEDGISNWIGDIESLNNGECNSVSPYIADHNFAVGGVCTNEMAVGLAYQTIDLTAYSEDILAGDGLVSFGGYLRNFSGVDLPEMYVAFYDAADSFISNTELVGSILGEWTLVENLVAIPLNSTECRFYLKGTRNGGTDNDSYFDELKLYVLKGSCTSCYGDSNIDQDGDGFCDDLDCNDNNSNIYPGALEVCDGLDNNCDGVFDQGNTITWTGNGTDDQWSNPQNWDHLIVPLSCQFVIIPSTEVIIVDGVFACKGIDTGQNSSLTIVEGSFLNIDSQEDSNINPACISGLLLVDGKWEVK